MIEKVVKKRKLEEFSEIKEDLAYWLSKSPEERVAAVEFLRMQHHGTSERLQRVVKVIQRS
jgi:hypothetical protein